MARGENIKILVQRLPREGLIKFSFLNIAVADFAERAIVDYRERMKKDIAMFNKRCRKKDYFKYVFEREKDKVSFRGNGKIEISELKTIMPVFEYVVLNKNNFTKTRSFAIPLTEKWKNLILGLRMSGKKPREIANIVGINKRSVVLFLIIHKPIGKDIIN